MKTCSYCGKSRHKKDFYRGRGYCRRCAVIKAVEHRAQVKRAWLNGDLSRPEKKYCPSCRKTKVRKHFGNNTTTKSGLAPYCLVCVRKQHNAYRRSHIGYHLVRTARTRAKARGLKCDLKRGDVTVPKRCPVLGIALKVGDGRQRRNSPTLDRIDNKKGYVRGNVIVVSYRANAIKQDATPQELMKVALFYKGLR